MVFSALVSHGSFSRLKTWCSSRTPRRSVSTSSKRGRLAWKVKGSVSTCRRPSSGLRFYVGHDAPKKSGKYPCAVCCNGVSSNSIGCWQCKLWIHKRGSGIPGRLMGNPNYACCRCNGKVRLIHDRSVNEVEPCLTRRSPSATWMTCCALVGAVTVPMLHGIGKVQESLTFPNHGNVCSMLAKRGERTTGTYSGCAVIRCICGTNQRSSRNTPSFITIQTFHWGYYGITSESAAPMVWTCTACHVLYQTCHKGTLEGYGGTRGRGRPRKSWPECAKTDVSNCSWLPLTHKTAMHEEPVFDIAWCCQPHRMAHGQHPNLKWIWVDGWSRISSIYVSIALRWSAWQGF